MYENVTAVVPAFNEADRITDTIRALKAIEGITEIIAIDDGSTDDTFIALKKIDNIKIIKNNKNRGKGYAIKSALDGITSRYVLFVDADLGNSALEMKKLVENPKINSRSMLVALYPTPIKKGGFGFVKKLSTKSLYFLTSKTTESILSGQRLVSTDFIRSIELPDNFGLEFKITLEALKNDIEIIYIPLSIRHRETGRNLKGFIHRGKQFTNILSIVIKELM